MPPGRAPQGGVSIVVPAWRAMSTLPDLLNDLGREGGVTDIVVVESSADGSADEVRRRWPDVTVIDAGERMLPGRARNVGAARASGSTLVFVDADVRPAAGWLPRLLAPVLSGEADAVAGAVANGTPRHPVGTAGWLLEFSEVMPGRQARVRHGLSCNLAVTRTALTAAGGFPEDIFPGEDTILTMRIGRLAFAPDAVVAHSNRTGLGEFLRHQFRLGVSFAAVCAAVPLPYRRFARPALAPLGGVLRLAALGVRLSSQPRLAVRALALSPLLVAGMALWTAGVVHGSQRATA